MSSVKASAVGEVLRAADHARARASCNYFLRWIQLISEEWKGDIITGVVFLAIVDENTRMIRAMDSSPVVFSGGNALPPDEVRQPVSVYHLSRVIGLSYETTRRYVNKLMADGVCVRVDVPGGRGGVIVPRAVLTSDSVMGITVRNLANLDDLQASLASIGG